MHSCGAVHTFWVVPSSRHEMFAIGCVVFLAKELKAEVIYAVAFKPEYLVAG